MQKKLLSDAELTSKFLEFILEIGLLKLGDFTLKSGRKSPYFFNAGAITTNSDLTKLGYFFAQKIMQIMPHTKFDLLFGPAYKGIPLVCATVICLKHCFGQEVSFAFNRKEAKQHGEGGVIVGAEQINQRVLILDDVITMGTAVKQSIEIIEHHHGQAIGILVALDREESKQRNLSTSQELQKSFGIPIHSIANIQDLVNYLKEKTSKYGSSLIDAIVLHQKNMT